MKKITEFKEIEPYEDYDYNENSCRYNLLELTPKELVWKFNNICYSIYNSKGVQASLIDNDTRILIIDGVWLYDEQNKAYVVNGKNEIEVNISSIVNGCSLNRCSLNGFYFQENHIFFFAYSVNERVDYLIKFNKKFKFISKNLSK